MKSRLILSIFTLAFFLKSAAQTPQTFGNTKIIASDAAWAEGIVIVKPVGWSGLRLARIDPTAGNYNGNWAIGYNFATGNDLSISNNYNGTQYDGLFHISSTTRNVGIGTTSPKGKLHIAALMKALHPLYPFANRTLIYMVLTLDWIKV